MERNYSIDFLKILFALSIACGHFKGSVLSSGLIVELFFILSGFFLVNSFYSGKYHGDALSYTASRLKRIYPYYLLAFLILFISFKSADLLHPIRFLSDFANAVPEVLLVQSIGVFSGDINYPLWQLSTLIVASHILFALMTKDDQITLNVICPLTAICSFTYFSNAFGTHTVEYWGGVGNFLSGPLIRAFGALCLGMMVHRPLLALSEFIRTKFSDCAAFLLSALLIVLFWLARDSYAAHLLFIVFLAFCLSGKGIPALFNHKFFACGEKLSLAIYLNQAAVIFPTYHSMPFLARFSDTVQTLLFIPAMLLFAVLFLFIADHLFAWIRAQMDKTSIVS